MTQSLSSSDSPFDLYSTKIDADPFPYYEQLREQHPCYWSSDGNIWILSRYDDVFEASMNWQTYSSLKGNLVDEIAGRSGGTLGTTDPPRHDRLRSLAQAAFLKKNLAHIIKPTVELADICLKNIKKKKSFDFVVDYSSVITVGIIFRLLGLPEQNPIEMRNRVVLAISSDKEKRGRNPLLDAAFKEVNELVAKEVAIRRKKPTDDLVTLLAEAEIDGDKLTEREIVLTTSMFVVAGVESLSSFLSIFSLNLHDFPEARQRISANTELMPQAIEESLRFNTSAQRFKRVLTKDTELHGQTMRAGESVILAYGSANRDRRKFDKPDNYNIDRNPQGHLGFGGGKHFCIGSQFARLVTETAMKRFLEQIPNFELEHQDFGWIPSSNFRSPMSLPFRIA